MSVDVSFFLKLMGGQKTFFEHRRAKMRSEITGVFFIIRIDLKNIIYISFYILEIQKIYILSPHWC